MGCDIHGFTEKKNPETKFWEVIKRERTEDMEKWDSLEPFRGHRNYGLFGLLADVRNYSEIPVIKEATYELPTGCSKEVREKYGDGDDYHSLTSFTLAELLQVDLDKKFYDMRVMINGNGAAKAESLEEANHTTYREFLGPVFEQEVEALKKIMGNQSPEDVRIIIWFDN